MAYLIRIEDKDALGPALVGQKFSALARAVRHGFAVPGAVAISTAAHRFFLVNQRWPQELLPEVLEAANSLDLSRGLSIRSSATREDLEKQSFAGQYRSFLHIVNEQDLENKIEECWKSAASETVRSYPAAGDQAGASHEIPLMAVIIQKMVDGLAAGIAFGRNPMKPARQEIVIEAVKGLADDLVNGHRTPYRAIVAENGSVQVTPPPLTGETADDTDRMLRLYPDWVIKPCFSPKRNYWMSSTEDCPARTPNGWRLTVITNLSNRSKWLPITMRGCPRTNSRMPDT